MQIFWATMALIIGLGPDPEKANYLSKTQMINRADACIIGRIEKSRQSCAPDFEWTYCQEAKVIVDSVLWGTIDSTVSIHAAKDFRCPKEEWEKNRYLMFLIDESFFYMAANWNLSNYKIEDDSLLWLENDTTLNLAKQPIGKVLNEIKKIRKPNSKPSITEPQP